MNNPTVRTLIVIALIAAAGFVAYPYRDQLLPQPEPPAPAPAVAVEPEPATEDTGPRHPIGPLAAPDSAGELTPLPALDDSDAYFLLEVGNVLGGDIEGLLLREAIIDRLVATVDNLTRGQVSERTRPVQGLADLFRPTSQAGSDQLLLGPDSYQRYGLVVARIGSADIDAVTDIYRRFYPLFQDSYERLGYPNAYFNDRVIEVIDHLLETPMPAEPIELVRPKVLYQFADPALESLSSGRKLMLRMGPAHAATMKSVLRELRARLAANDNP